MPTPAIILVDVDFSAERLAAKFTVAAEKAENPVEVLFRIGVDMYRIEGIIFNSDGRRGGGSWKKLKDDTIVRKRSDKILVQSDALRQSVTEPDAPYSIFETTPTQLIFGTDRPWAEVQQFGSTYNDRPARPFIRFLPTDLDRWNTWLMEHLMEPFLI